MGNKRASIDKLDLEFLWLVVPSSLTSQPYIVLIVWPRDPKGVEFLADPDACARIADADVVVVCIVRFSLCLFLIIFH